MSRRKPLVIHRIYTPDDARCVEVLLRLLKKDHICHACPQVELDAGRKEGQDRLAQLNSAGSEHVVVPAQTSRGACLTTSRHVVSASGMPGPASNRIVIASESVSAGPGNIIESTLVTSIGDNSMQEHPIALTVG